MAEFTVVHLSDLHISTKVTATLRNLINHVADQVKDKKCVILLISGDIVNAGRYFDCPDATYKVNKYAIKFFELLNSRINEVGGREGITPCKIIDIQIVPGNHDKDMDGIYGDSDAYMNFCGSVEEWTVEKARFKGFLALSNAIFDIFGIKNQITKKNKNGFCQCALPEESKRIDDTIGVEFIDIPCLGQQLELASSVGSMTNQNSCCDRCKEIPFKLSSPELTIAFIRLNTALSSFGGAESQERHNLLLGEYQINHVKLLYQEGIMARNEHDIVTFVIAHHPTAYFKPELEDAFRESLLDESALNANYYVSGHTHTRSFMNLSKNESKVTFLVTSFGPDSDNPDWENHTYSIYTFSEEKNSMTTQMFIADMSRRFIPDTAYYTEKQRKDNRITMPFRSADYPTVRLSSTGNVTNELFFDEETLKQIKEIDRLKQEFVLNMKQAMRVDMVNSCKDALDKGLPIANKFGDNVTSIIRGDEIPANHQRREGGVFFTPQIDESIKKIISELSRNDQAINNTIFRSYLDDVA